MTALAIPHSPWIPERVESMQRLWSQLHFPPRDLAEDVNDYAPNHVRLFTDREPNAIWSLKMWQWLYDTNAEWCLSLQDDTEVASCFWSALDTMIQVIEPLGAEVLGLSSVHPVQAEIARQGHRWYRTASHLVGWAYAIKREALGDFLRWRALNPDAVRTFTEDSLLNHFVNVSGRATWHPVPTIVDHDTTIESSYGNDKHVHRRPWISWRDFSEGSLTDPSFWRPGGPVDTIPLLPAPAPSMCWACSSRVARVNAGAIRLCTQCVAQAATVLITQGER